jgi:hypothetical protein
MIINPATGWANRAPDKTANADLAHAIIEYRKTTPFTSLFDLNKVMSPTAGSDFQNALGRLNPTATSGTGVQDPDQGWGDYSGDAAGTGPDGVVGDFEARFLMMNRLSNLVTTRSDTFTCYVLVQGWRGVGSSNPELVVQRRRAFMADRTGVTPTARDVSTQNFYNE